ncbi:magnesium chelatase subunit H [Candidatus Thiodictyon syntrophicum]|jgi:magnesium chelatase subunit H|uniref:magnesium chelatase n=1 Tax=Candidatus Thiodictyon syntrophicum TaxID=1166950 RepID=A0A2K8UIS5_9GAMM|nr:magnesium chelatase subunit H [Candidatus Thiodictyon syntrophicum]AUB85435.1 magnesium chelatase subunit H [Candidatus Thiodictyon syntrophicum]
MRKRTSDADRSTPRDTPIRVVIVALDGHLAGTLDRARPGLRRDIPGLALSLHAAAEWAGDPQAVERCRADVATADIVINTMLVMEEHIQPILPALQARRDHCDAMVSCMSAGEVMRLTRMGGFSMDGKQGGPLALLKRLRGGSKKEGQESNAGSQQMSMLRRIPKLLRFIPGTAQDVRAYFLSLQYWLAGSEENIANMVRYLVDRYADGERRGLRGTLKVPPPLEYPDVGIYHPRLPGHISDDLGKLPPAGRDCKGTVGLLLMRSYVLAGNANHYDGVIASLESRGLRVVPAYASGLDARPAVERFFMHHGRASVDAVVSLTGFSLVGGPAYNDAKAAQELLTKLDVPYLSTLAVEFQTMEQWQDSDQGLLPVEATMMVAIPELDGSTGPMVFGGRSNAVAVDQARDMQSHNERTEMLASRVARLVSLRRTARRDRKVAIVLFNFPPNAGNTGTAAYLSVFSSLFNTLTALKAAGYAVDVPKDVDALREGIVNGNASRYGAHANVHARVPVDHHVRREPYLKQIEKQWGSAPGKQQADGRSIFVLGERYGNVFVGVQPAFGYEGDPMRLLFEKGFTPTHAFTAFYRYLKEEFGADAVLHFGTHGALEFMPGKQSGLSAECWPDRLIGDLPNLYLYASNNPSEGTIAKRRAAATLISYLTPPIAHAGLYRGLIDLKGSIERWRSLPPDEVNERHGLAELIQAQGAELDLNPAEPAWGDAFEEPIARLNKAVLELEYTLIPDGLHIVGQAPTVDQRIDLLLAIAEASHDARPPREALAALVGGANVNRSLAAGSMPKTEENVSLLTQLGETNRLLTEQHEIPSILHALDGGYVRPAPGGDLLRTPEILPTGRNLHGFDPYRIPSRFAVADGARQTQRLLERYAVEGNPLPECVALVLWGTDNLKTEGGPIAQALALMGTVPRFDSFGRLTGATLIPLAELGRPRIDCVMTLSGIFRDLLPLQTRLLADASYLAATADEPLDQNFVRKHALAYQEANGCDLETAALRVFSNADGAYGANVNYLVDSSRWDEGDELAETYTRRKCFAYGRSGKPMQNADLLTSVLGNVELAYQNLDSVELGVTSIDHYFDTLGGISRAVGRARGTDVPVFIGDQTTGDGVVRTLAEQVALETRTRMLNPKWYEGMLAHGYEGVRQIETHVTNTMGWSATTGQVAPWVYQRLTETYVLDDEMRERLAALNPTASAKVASRLIEAHERNYWTPDAATLEALRRAGEELEDRLEGVFQEAAA